MKPQLGYQLDEIDAMMEWQDKLARDSQWCTADDRKKINSMPLHPYSAHDTLEVRLKKKEINDFVNKVNVDTISEKKEWNALIEEDGFHVKEQPDEFDQVQFSKYCIEKGIHPGTAFKELPDGNAKTLAAVGKPTYSPIPPIALMALGAAMQDGVNKYGIFNWRDSKVTSTVFYDAILRHLFAWYSGEQRAPDSGIHHLAHAMAGLAILLDAEYHSVLNDDRKAWQQKVTQEEFNFIKRK